jgi:hypothetical protein
MASDYRINFGRCYSCTDGFIVNKIKDDDDFGWNFNYYFKFKIIKIIIMVQQLQRLY